MGLGIEDWELELEIEWYHPLLEPQRSVFMATSRLIRPIIGLAVCLSLYSILPVSSFRAQQPANDVAIDNDDIGGVVNGAKGPEAGVWVIAETRDLPVRYIKTVVTDDRGRFVVPDLPQRSTPCGRAGMAWWTARRQPADPDSA